MGRTYTNTHTPDSLDALVTTAMVLKTDNKELGKTNKYRSGCEERSKSSST